MNYDRVIELLRIYNFDLVRGMLRGHEGVKRVKIAYVRKNDAYSLEF